MGEDKNSPDEIRKKYLYRSLIVKGQVRVREKTSTRRLIGPDCAYHLYSVMKRENDRETDDNMDPEPELKESKSKLKVESEGFDSKLKADSEQE